MWKNRLKMLEKVSKLASMCGKRNRIEEVVLSRTEIKSETPHNFI